MSSIARDAKYETSKSEANLQGVDQILYEEQPAELFHTGVGVQQDFVGIFANLVLG